MDFLTTPPEVTSALIHSGPGAGSLIEASGAWQRLGAGLEESASSYASAVSSLIESWHGQSSIAMVQAVEPYLTWLRTTAQQCQQIASSSLSAATAFSSALSAVIHPAEVSANRTRLTQLLATNGFGRNLAAIAETEAQYEGMWANNSAAMTRYQAASAQAATLPQFSLPPPIANPTGVAAQASAASAVTTSTTTGAATSALDSILQSLQSFDPNKGWFGFAETWGNQIIAGGLPINLLGYLAQASAAKALQSVGGEVGSGLAEGESSLGTPGSLGALGAAGLTAEPTAALGIGVSAGKLTMPPAVVGLVPASQAQVQLASAVSPLPSEESEFPMLPPLMPPPIAAGSGWRKRTPQKYGDRKYVGVEEDEEEDQHEDEDEDIKRGLDFPSTVMPKHPSGG